MAWIIALQIISENPTLLPVLAQEIALWLECAVAKYSRVNEQEVTKSK